MLQLPDDLLAYISTFLSNKEKKRLRSTSKRLHSFCTLRIDRVFISPSYKNIEVFRAIADHPVLCKQVKEIIWDDARFEKFEPDDQEDDSLPEERVRNKVDFENAREENLMSVAGEENAFVQARASGFDPVTVEPLSTEPLLVEEYLSLDESFDLYNRLYEEQETIIRDGLDVEAFREGLRAFTALQRVTVTSEAYRPNIITPCYSTPLIISFPLGYSYPAPWPWMPETVDEAHSEISLEDIKTHWHGVAVVLDALAKHDRLIPEFVIDTRYEQLGIPYQLFDSPSDILTNFETLCRRGLRRLDLAINTFCNFRNPGLRQLPRGQLKSVLAKATSLEHFSLHASSGEHAAYDSHRVQNETMDALSAIPLHSWLLKHITLSSVPVIYSDLVEFLRRLPKDIRSVGLINVEFTESTYKQLLEKCRDELHWTAGRPKLAIAHQEGGQLESRKLWVEEDIADFFRGGHNPFEGRSRGNWIQQGFGVLRDDFDEDFCKSNVPDPMYHVCTSPGVYRVKTREEVAEEQRQREGGE
ncbi:hypothetical protein M409DRAFT_23299 [Zasmidium cellare ATCC 36951]|uniref:F-box domain-containing protein n=1 Tax=Zasmidium cellare ATCC 36951 TaxID=1080233 RepID=A0A6A6CKD9_ZASCE|nr:uncharacterized protein M409DRAFT_23299 [Zasmidium cellare ATCC 36951]KAF2166668.1 hypothetical protein M409DRAFT_23299 [Zasmidium cellare ATCC 36951]